MKLIFLSLLVIIFILTVYNNTSTIDHFIDLPPNLSKTIDTINKEIELQSNKTNAIDLNKYILKTEIPVCPKQINMDNYIEKNKFPDMSKYILKTQLPICPKIPDLGKFVLKSSVPPPKKCPTCPTCPKCSKCPNNNKLNTNTIDSLSISNINKASCK